LEPAIGYYLFVAATMLSIGITHFMVYYHRKVHSKNHIYSDEKKTLSDEPKSLRIIVLLFIFICIIILLVGISINSFSFFFKGAAGQLLAPPARQEDFSVLSLGK
jgi:ABC-type Fe3+ transport system permease subunit